MSCTVALFHTISAALRAEKMLIQAEVPTKLIPTPRQLSSDCGVALRFETARRKEVEDLLTQSRMGAAEVHNLTE